MKGVQGKWRVLVQSPGDKGLGEGVEKRGHRKGLLGKSRMEVWRAGQRLCCWGGEGGRVVWMGIQARSISRMRRGQMGN